MGLTRQAKTLSRTNILMVKSLLASRRHSKRNLVIFLLSVRAGLRAKEIADLKWNMLTDASGNLCTIISLPDAASKGRSGRTIPICRELREACLDYLAHSSRLRGFDIRTAHVVRTERSQRTSAQAIVNMFAAWYTALGFHGCSSHSGRRTFITNAARKISTVGGSLRDVQILAGHSSMQTTQRYIEASEDAMRKVVEIT